PHAGRPRARAREPRDRRRRARGPTDVARAGVLPPDARRGRRRAVHAVEAAQHVRRRRRAPRPARRAGGAGRRAVQDGARPARHTRRPGPAALLDRRAPAAVQRRARRHVARRAALAARGGGRAVRRPRPPQAACQARPDRPVAGVGAFRPELGRGRAPRPAVRRQLVVDDGPDDPVEDGTRRPHGVGRLLTTSRPHGAGCLLTAGAKRPLTAVSAAPADGSGTVATVPDPLTPSAQPVRTRAATPSVNTLPLTVSRFAVLSGAMIAHEACAVSRPNVLLVIATPVNGPRPPSEKLIVHPPPPIQFPSMTTSETRPRSCVNWTAAPVAPLMVLFRKR